jgi:histidinol-phosphate aminotransferase
MQPQVPDYIRSLVPYVPGKPIEETQREFKIRKVVKLASNENSLGPSPRALRAIQASLKESHRYPDASHFSLKTALSTHLRTAPDTLIVGNGSNEIIDLLIRTFALPGDCIVTSRAAFVAYRLCAQIHGVSTLEAPLTPDLRFDLGAVAELARQNEKAKLVFIANPNNPTGTYVNSTELRAFLKTMAEVRDGSVLVVLDYAYWEYVTAGDLPDALELLREYPNVVVLRTFSKIYGLAGLRVGYGVGRPEVIASVEKVRQPFNLNSLGMVAAEAALGDRLFVSRSRELNEEGMKLWTRELEAMSVPFWKSQGNFILIDATQGFGKPGADVYQACLKQGVILRPVANYGLHHALRISVGTPAENRAAIRALRNVR